MSHADDISAAESLLRKTGGEVFVDLGARRLTAPADGLADLPGVHALELTGDQVRLDVDGDRVEPVLQALVGLGVTSIVAHPPTLEQLLMRHYGDELPSRQDAEVA